MSTSAEVYSGLSSIGLIQAKFVFYTLVVIFAIFVLIMVLNIVSQLSILRAKNVSQTKKDLAREELNSSIKILIIVGLIFCLSLLGSYWNLKETEESKSYAATEGAMDVISDLNRM